MSNMKMKFLLALAALCAVGSGFWLMTTEDVVTEYVPREDIARESAAGAAEIYRMLKANVETGEIEPKDYIRTRKAYERIEAHAPKELEMSWEQMGPNNIGGRVRGILAVNNELIYAGGVSGGLWRSTNAGNNWEMVRSFPFMPISSIDMTLDGTIFVATGTTFDGGSGEGQSGFVGHGLFMSDDGDNWEIVPGTRPSFLSNGGDWSYIDQLQRDPNDPDRMWIAFNDGLAYYDVDTESLYDPGEDGPLSGLSPNSQCDDLQISVDGSLMFVEQGGQVYRSTDFGQSWASVSSTSDPTKIPRNNVGRIELAIAPSDQNYCYALLASSSGAMRGGFYSTDAGLTWTEGWPGGVESIDLFGFNGQGIYDNILTVDRNDPTRCLAGGVTLWQFGSDQQPEQIAFNFTFPGSPLYVHSDIHEFEWAPNGDLYIGTDGGIHKSTDNGESFFTANRNFITTQYYGIAYTPGGGVIGGTQDNGTWYIPYDGSLSELQNGSDLFGGDGFDADVSQVTEAPIGQSFVTSQFGSLARLDEQGGGGEFFDDDILALQNTEGRIGQFYTVIQLYENTNDPNSQQFLEAVNPFGETVVSTSENPVVLNLQTENQGIPFDYTIPIGDTLHYYDTIVRPAFVSNTLVSGDPDYYWLGSQPLDSTALICEVDSTIADIARIITGYEPVDSTIFVVDTLFVNGQPVIYTDSIVVTIDSIPLLEEVITYNITESCDSLYYYGSDIYFEQPERIRVQDRYTSMFAIGFVGNQGVWLTREALDLNTSPDWWKVINSVEGTTKAIEFTADGRHMFVSTWSGNLYRVDGLENLWRNSDEPDDVDLSVLTVTEIFETNNNAALTGIAIDPNDADHIVITIGGYGGTAKVRESFNATSVNPSFSNIWSPPTWEGNSLNGLPVYDAVIDMTNSNTIIVGTEFGILGTDDGGDTWSILNNGDMSPAPVFDLAQQWNGDKRFMNPTNTGIVYAGTHGRGIFQSSDIVSVDELGFDDFGSGETFTVYPNPVSTTLQADINLQSASDLDIEVYSITGKLVYSDVMNNLAMGTHTIRIPVNELSLGNYVVSVRGTGFNETAKFIVTR